MLGSGMRARVGTGSVPWFGRGAVGGWVETIEGRVANEPAVSATPSGNTVGLDIGKDTGVGGGWVEAIGGRTTKESLMVAAPMGDKLGPEVGARTAVDVGGGTGVSVTGIGPSQAKTSANVIRANPQAA